MFHRYGRVDHLSPSPFLSPSCSLPRHLCPFATFPHPSFPLVQGLIRRFCWAGGAPKAETTHLERPSFERRSHSTTSLDAYFQASTSVGSTPHGERPGSGSYFSTQPQPQPQPSSSHSHSHSMSSTPSGSYFSSFSSSTQDEPSQASSSSGESAIGLDLSGKGRGGGGLELNTNGTMSPSITMSPPVVY
jgi:hypothetical protein